MRVIIVDDQHQVRSALKLILAQEADLEVVGEASDFSSTVNLVLGTHPDALLMDWELPGSRGPVAINVFRSLWPALVIIALSSRPEARQEALNAGVNAFVSKGGPPERLLETVKSCCLREIIARGVKGRELARQYPFQFVT